MVISGVRLASGTGQRRPLRGSQRTGGASLSGSVKIKNQSIKSADRSQYRAVPATYDRASATLRSEILPPTALCFHQIIKGFSR